MNLVMTIMPHVPWSTVEHLKPWIDKRFVWAAGLGDVRVVIESAGAAHVRLRVYVEGNGRTVVLFNEVIGINQDPVEVDARASALAALSTGAPR